MKGSILTTACLLATALHAQEAPLWLRNAAISPDGRTIAFCYQGDIWRVPATGGEAVPLTTNDAYDHSPVWNRDGSLIAFSSNRHGNNDVFVMPSTGGAPTRLTFHGYGEVASDFSADGTQVIFYGSRQDDARHQQFPVGGMGELYTVPVKGGRVLQVSTVAMERARCSPDGKLIAYHDRKGYEDNWRKHHTSSVTRDIWTFNPATKEYKQLTAFAGEDRNPVWSKDGGTLYYLSEESGSFNVHRMPATGGASTQVSRFTDHPVRYLSISDDGTLCFSFRGELYTMRDGGQPQKVGIRINSDGRYNPERTLPVGSADEFAVSPNGKEVAFIHRGEVFVSSVAEGTTRRITSTPEQERSVGFSPDGRTLLYASERGQSWDLYTTTLARKEEKYFFNATVLKEEPLLATPVEEFQPAYSPDGKEVAYLEERTTLKVLNLATKQTRVVVPGNKNYSYSDGDQWYQWSPDSKWFTVGFLHDEQWIMQVGLVSASGKEPIVNLTRSGYGGYMPRWALDGKAIVYMSDRDGQKNHASWGGESDAYVIFLTQEAYDKFRLTKEEAALAKEDEEKKDEGKDEKKDKEEKKGKDAKEEKKDEVKPIKIELDGIEYRRARLTPNSSALSDAALSKDGEKLYYLAAFEKGTDLWQYEIRTREAKILQKMGEGWANGLTWDKEGKKLFYWNNGGISHYDTEKNEHKGVGIRGELVLNENAERAYLFEHIWRQVKKKFYRVDLQGVDWDKYKLEYQRYLPHINNNFDMAELCSEMLGELNASHTGAGYRHHDPAGDETATLGCFFANEPGPGLRIVEIMPKSPLLKEGSKVKAGHVIEKVDGAEVAADIDWARLFNRKGDKPMLLSLYDPKTKTRWDETVKPLPEGGENELLYKRWVERCRHLVDSLSGGQLGYVHVRGMNDQSFRTVYEEALGRYHNKKGLVVDTRFNGGGWLHDDLATFLNGKTYMTMMPRDQKLGTEPHFKYQRPSVVVMSESNYSDAHLFPVTYRALGVGKLVGMPVPGTGTAVWWEGLQNGMWFGIPQVGMVDNAGNYMENLQLEPDVRQPLEPGAASQGRDQQLEAAVKALLGN
jgi:Tol biopolymer transport system component/C-terminal processing protease CtpA/Prc